MLPDGLSGMGNAILDLKEMQARLLDVNEAANASVTDDIMLIEITRIAMEIMTFHWVDRGRTFRQRCKS